MTNQRPKDATLSETSASYPFTAIVGQDEMKLALVLNAIDPRLGGVVIMGHRGTSKSTAVRSLAELLPQISVVAGCHYQCDPNETANLCVDCKEDRSAGAKLKVRKQQVKVVDLPLGATEDRVCGTLDIERALTEGIRSFEPGLLARANRGFLYIDEVNLLDDHLVDLLLDVSVTGVNRVERESISIEHPARFVLVGSGNPEEGELRPQLLDRFALNVQVVTENDLNRRVEIVERHQAFDSNRDAFSKHYEKNQEQLRRSIVRARNLFRSVTVGKDLLRKIAELCSELKLDGHRGELTLARAARALAALESRRKVTMADVKRVAPMALRHRLRRQPFDDDDGNTRVQQAVDQVLSDGSSHGTDRKTSNDPSTNGKPASANARHEPPPETGRFDVEHVFDPGSKIRRRTPTTRTTSRRKPVMKSDCDSQRGRYYRATVSKRNSIAVDATIRAAAAHGDLKSSVTVDSLRYKQFKRRAGSLYIFVIDTSGSMASSRIARARELATTLLRRSYLHRDSVAMVMFRGTTAQEVLPPCRSILRAKRALDSLSVGGGTPLSAGVIRALEIVKRTGQSHGRPTMLLFTDGGANVLLSKASVRDRNERARLIAAELTALGNELGRERIRAFVISTRSRFGSDDARLVAEQLGAEYT